MELSVDKLLEMRGKPVYDRSGEKIGSIEDIYIDDDTHQPEWLGLGMGFLGMKRAVVPLAGASLRQDGIAVPYEKDRVKDAPDADGEDISAEQEAELARHYAIGTAQPSQRGTQGTALPTAEHTTTTPPSNSEITTTSADDERQAAKRDAPAGHGTVHKYIEPGR